MHDCLTQCIPRAYKLWLRGTGASSGATVGSAIRTKVYMPITQCTNGQIHSQVPWCMVLDSTAPTEALLSVGGCQIVVVEGGI